MWVIFELKVLPLERDGVIEEELRSAFENVRESISREIPMERVYDIGEHKGNIAGQGFVEDRRQGRECIVGTNSDARNSAIGKDENGSDGVDVLLNLGRNTFLVALVLLNTPSVGQPRRVEDADLGKRLRLVIMFTMPALTTMPLLLLNW